MSPLAQELRRLIAAYAAGRVTFPDFSIAFTLANWDVPESDPEAYHLSGEAELLVAEFTSGHRSEDNLRAELLDLLSGELDLAQAPSATLGVNATDIEIHAGPTGPWRQVQATAVGTRSEAAFA